MKISVIMQSFLGEYNGSRKDSVFKLERALKSFQANKSNSELVLISDNCQLTKKVWEEKFSDDSRIVFYHLKDDSKKMYHSDGDSIFFRGYPRQVGVELSKGDVITYMDSDDFILPDYLERLNQLWQRNEKYFWFFNNCWFENSKILESQPEHYFEIFEDFSDNPQKINNLESEWVLAKVRSKKLLMSPALFSHRRDETVKWSDCFINKDNKVSEDVKFINVMKELHPNGASITIPGYVRCHLRDFWDY